MVLNFRDDKPEVYKIQQVNLPQITSDELIKECSISCGVNPSQTKAVVTALVDRLIHYMSIGHGVKLDGFGSWKPSFRAKTTKKMEDADASTVTRKVIKFYPGKDFKNMISNMPIESQTDALDDEE